MIGIELRNYLYRRRRTTLIPATARHQGRYGVSAVCSERHQTRYSVSAVTEARHQTRYSVAVAFERRHQTWYEVDNALTLTN